MSNTANALAVLTAMEAGDRDGIVQRLAPDAVFWAPISAERRSNLPRPLNGAGDIAAMFTRAKHFAHMDATVLLSLEDGDHVVVHVRMQGQLNNGRPYDAPHLWLFRFAGRQVAEMWEYADTAYAFECFGI